MEFALMLPIIGILFVIIYAMSRVKWKKDKRVVLYKSLMSSGCTHCNGELELGEHSLQYLNLECKECDASYQLDIGLQMAWETTDDS